MRLPRPAALITVLTLAGATLALGAAAAPAASAADSSDYQVTFVARQCSLYSDIMANRARNNIQESLRDLGKDTVYTSGQVVTPAIEGPNDPRCVPLQDWQFALGTGYTGKSPSTAYLSTITGDYGQTIRVQPTTPELDAAGHDTGRELAAAVTVTLTPAQASLAQQGNRLWTQGGTKADPLLDSVFGPKYGFGALRCAADNLNGDNVEWLGFAAGSRHVFCYYYAVTPPPDAGTIVVRKSLETGSDGPATFRFVGNISYTTTHDFTLSPASDTAPASASFVRAAGDAWDFEEQGEPGFDFVSLTCTQTDGTGSTWAITGRKAVVRVGDGATVRCDYLNRTTPPATGELSLSKVTYGGTGSFPFQITDPSEAVTDVTGTTTAEGDAALVAHTPTGATGTWEVRETLPAPTPSGTWDVTSVQCDGAPVAHASTPGPDGTTYVTAEQNLEADQTAHCTFANTFTPGGALTIRKQALGGTGSFAFVVLRADQFTEDTVPTELFSAYGATVATAGGTATATPLSGQRPLTHLPVSDADVAGTTYFVSEFSPPATDTATWQPTSVACRDSVSGAVVPVTLYPHLTTASVRLTSAHPRVTCLAVNTSVPVGTFTVSKTIAGSAAGKQDAVQLDVTCTDGSTATLHVPAHATGTTSLATPLVLRAGGSCTVTESKDGENPDAVHSSTTSSTDGAAAVHGTTVTAAVATGQHVQVVVTDEYGGLAPSGLTRQTPVLAFTGLLLLLLGAAAYAASWRS